MEPAESPIRNITTMLSTNAPPPTPSPSQRINPHIHTRDHRASASLYKWAFDMVSMEIWQGATGRRHRHSSPVNAELSSGNMAEETALFVIVHQKRFNIRRSARKARDGQTRDVLKHRLAVLHWNQRNTSSQPLQQFSKICLLRRKPSKTFIV